MGVYTRPDSKYYYLRLDGYRDGRGYQLREKTPVRADATSAIQRRDNHRLAEQLFHRRMTQLAEQVIAARAQMEVLPSFEAPIRKALNGWCYIYFVRSGDRVKVGRAVDIPRRLAELRGANAKPIQLLGAIPAHATTEGLIHERFHDLRIAGEWFTADVRLLAFIAQVVEGTNPIALLWDSLSRHSAVRDA